MTRRLRFLQLDVFANRLFDGNPLAVVLDAVGLDTDIMQRIARWTNLSETTFLLPPTQPTADYRVRIFTTHQELPFAGHPSVGSAYAAIDHGLVESGKASLVQECAAGLLPVQVVGTGPSRIIHVQAPPARIAPGAADLTDKLAAALHAPLDPATIRLVDNGPRWIVCDMREASVVRGLHPDFIALASACEQASALGVCVFGHERDGTAAMAVRAFCPSENIPEDPVTGSANAAIAAYLQATGGLSAYGQRYRVSQGREVGRDGCVEVSVDPIGSAITIGGACVVGVRGELLLQDIR
jgi:PhzF family phenazine biosynthesis protein